MIRCEIELGPPSAIHCSLEGGAAQLMMEYHSIVAGMVKKLREKDKMSDEEIEKLLVEAIAIGFKVVDTPGGMREA